MGLPACVWQSAHEAGHCPPHCFRNAGVAALDAARDLCCVCLIRTVGTRPVEKGRRRWIWRHVDARGRRLARLAVSQSAGKSHHWQRAAWLLAGRRQHTPLRILADARGRRAHCNGAPDLHGRRSEVQPFKYAFGGEPAPRDYGRTIADGALLILLACFGLAEHGHETTPEVMQFACVSMWLYGWVRSLDCPVQGALWWGGALGLLALASSPPLAVALLAGSLLWMLFTREFRP